MSCTHRHTKVKSKKHRLLFLPHIEEGEFQDRCDSYTDSGTQFCCSALLSLVCFSRTKQLLKLQSSHQQPQKQKERREKENLDLFSWILARGTVPHFWVLCVSQDLVSIQQREREEQTLQFHSHVSSSKSRCLLLRKKGGQWILGQTTISLRVLAQKATIPYFWGKRDPCSQI